jgi:glycosyltransferase involved in cell wall biosynthesis
LGFLISIITPAFNAEHTIELAIASVQRQSREDWELIIIDDGSTDATTAIAEGVSDRRIKVLRQENAGLS